MTDYAARHIEHGRGRAVRVKEKTRGRAACQRREIETMEMIAQFLEGKLLTDRGYTILFFIGCLIGAVLSYG